MRKRGGMDEAQRDRKRKRVEKEEGKRSFLTTRLTVNSLLRGFTIGGATAHGRSALGGQSA